jgi:peptidoglycan hydrolase CwlO-like protein
MKLSTRLKIFKWKIIAVVTFLLVLILALITFGVYVKVKSLSSFITQEKQANIAAEQTEKVEDIGESLEGMENALSDLNAEIREIRREMCLERDKSGESCGSEDDMPEETPAE